MNGNWTTASVFSVKEPEVEIKRNIKIEFEIDPLAIVIQMLDKDCSPPQIYDTLANTESTLSTSVKEEYYPSAEAFKKAEDIRSFFKRRYVHRRLTGIPPTRFIEGVEEVLHAEKTINLDKLKVLVKLPIFYDHTIEVEDLFAKHVAFPDAEHQRTEIELTLVKVLQKKAKRNQMYQLFFADKDKHLYYHLVQGNNEVKLWKHLNGIGSTIKLTAHIAKTKFYDTDFTIGHFSSYEFTPADS